MELSARLRELRKQNGLTQQQVSQQLNIDRSTYSYYEIGKICPSINSIQVLCDFYDITVDELLNGSGESSAQKAASPSFDYDGITAKSDDEKKLLSCYRKLDDMAKEEFLISIVGIARESEE